MDWDALVPRIIHPTKMLIIEAIQWINRPMSATELERVFDKTIDLSSISYHVTTLAKLRILRQVDEQKVRGATERFYFFTTIVGSSRSKADR